MFADQYELLDFGHGRRLERLAEVRLDRPCPAAEGLPLTSPEQWPLADARFERGTGDRGCWSILRQLPRRWLVAWETLRFELKPTEFGHLGLFPEQAQNWRWIIDQVRAAGRRLRILNLFAYTGGSTLAAAVAGAEVTHVDAAKNIVAWARRNAELSGLSASPLRWIVEDARKFVRRELQRGNRYDAVILDPPSYGHGAHGEVWRLARDLPRLLTQCAQLTAGQRQFMLLTCHTPGFDPPRLARLIRETLGATDAGRTIAEPLVLRTAAGRELPSGASVRWEAGDCPL